MDQLVWDEDPQRAKQFADQLKVPVAQSVEQILNDPRIKAVIICSETNRHLTRIIHINRG